MNSKSDQSNHSADGGNYEYPIESCNHLISTSLRNLSEEYQNLSRNKVDSTALKEKKRAKAAQEAKSDLKLKS